MERELIDKKAIIAELFVEYHFKYARCPEGEDIKDYEKRVLRGEGLLLAISIIDKFGGAKINP